MFFSRFLLPFRPNLNVRLFLFLYIDVAFLSVRELQRLSLLAVRVRAVCVSAEPLKLVSTGLFMAVDPHELAM